MLKRLVLAGAVMTAAVPVVRAADFEAPAGYDWSGFYIGAHAGYGSADIDYQFNADDIFSNSAGSKHTESLDGLIGGGQIGHNWHFDNLVLGLEGSFTWAGLDAATLLDSGIGSNPTARTGVDWLAALTPRFGFAFDNVLLYGKGGLALADLSTRLEQDVLAGLSFSDDDKTEIGWTIGAGAEVALSENWIIGMEADYYDFGTYGADKDVTNPPDPPRPGTDYDVDASLWSVLARISYKFGGQ
jgi:outer membrane immunogenic protein